ncbi:MAG TPA: DoxX family protein [Gemmatimonadaceae bacterium]
MSLFRASPRNVNLGLTILRIATAVVFINHGRQKLFVYGFTGVSGAFAHMGVPAPGLMGPLIGILEFFGGIALLIGLFTRLLSLAFVCDMLGAIFLVQLSKGFGGFEFEFMLLCASLTLALAGAGRFGVDEMLAQRRERGSPASVR